MRLRLGELLVAAGVVTDAQLQDGLAQQAALGLRLGETLVSLGHVTEVQVTQALSSQLTLPWVNLHHVAFSRELLEQVPAALAERYQLIPVYTREVRRQGRTLYVAMHDPTDIDALQAVADAAALPVKAMVAPPSDIRNAIRVYYLGLSPERPAAAPAPESGEPSTRGVVRPSQAPPDSTQDAVPGQSPGPTFLTLTLLDGTEVRLPTPGRTALGAGHDLTTRDLVHALCARNPAALAEVLPDGRWEPLVATLLTILLRKGVMADWEFVDAWKKHRSARPDL